MKFISKVLKLAQNNVTVALSSGVDSLSVAHFLKTKYPKIKLKCFHYNHNLRKQNFLMQEKAIEFCNKFDIELTIRRREYSVDHTEDSLRTDRYNAMRNEKYVVTGHHLNDACENYLFNCFNGTPEYLPIPLVTGFASNLIVIRPFILTKKIDMIKYIENNNLQEFVVEDETNNDEKHRRNWLRNSIIPQVNNKGYNLETIVFKRYKDYLNNINFA